MNPDIVYIYNHTTSEWRGQELRFSLRSLEVFGMNYRNVVLVGDKPEYLNDKITFIPMKEVSGYKEIRIFEKLLKACKSELVSDPFIFFNDDFFLVKKINFQELPYYYFDNLANKIRARQRNDIHKIAMSNTRTALLQREHSTRFFDIHYPMKYSKYRLSELKRVYNWDIRAGYVIKSLYANTFGIEGKSKPDCKFLDERSKSEVLKRINGTDLFSTGKVTRAIAEILQKMFPEKSSYEK